MEVVRRVESGALAYLVHSLIMYVTPFNNNLSNLGDIIKLKESRNDIRYLIGNNKNNSNNNINFRNFITSVTNFLLIIFKNCKKTYR